MGMPGGCTPGAGVAMEHARPLVTIRVGRWVVLNHWVDGMEVWSITPPLGPTLNRRYTSPEGAKRAIRRRTTQNT